MSESKDTQKNNMLKHTAFEYMERGWNIFPLTPGQKTPLAEALPSGSQNATLSKPFTEEEVEQIWTKYETANIGVHTGHESQIAVIDIDVAKTEAEQKKGKRTPAQAQTLAQQLLALFGDTQVHKSPSGGYHLIYRYTPLCDGVGRKINAFKSLENVNNFHITPDSKAVDLSDIDILAGKGYVVAPPSVVTGPDGEAEYFIANEVSDAEMPDFPEELLKLLNRRDKVAKAYFELKDGLAQPITSDNANEKKLETVWNMGGEQKLNAKLQQFIGAGAGGRHDALLKVCGTVFSHLPYKEWNKAHKYVDMVISTFNPPYFQGSDAEIASDRREVRNAFEYAKANAYVDRVNHQAAHNEQMNELVTEGVKELKESGVEIDEEEYRERVAQVFDNFQKDNKGNPIPNDYNVAVILRDHPKYQNRIRYDHFTEQLTYKCRIGREYKDHYLDDSKDNPALSRLMQDIQFEFFPRVPRISVYSAAVSVAHDHGYDSYREQMDNLIDVWDGEERMENWLHKMYKCPDDAYHRGVAAQFIFAMVRRAYEPGAEFQKVLFLSGEQGTGKSFAMKILGGDDGYLEFNDEIAGREFNLHAKGRTIIDLAEGESMHRSSVRRIKALISDNAGVHRTFGSGEVKEHPVRYVMSITNNHSPLVDNTGNRRFLVVNVPLPKETVGDYLWLKSFRKQIFAEAVTKYHKMKELEAALNEKIREADEEGGGEKMYALFKEQSELQQYERRLNDFAFSIEDNESEEVKRKFRTAYDVPLIPQEVSESHQNEARMKSAIEMNIEAVLMSYDEYRAGHNSFFVTADEIMNQLDPEVLRQSRMGSYALSEVSRMIVIVDSALERYRARSGEHKDKRGYRFEITRPDAKKRLDALYRIRKRAEPLRGSIPSEYGGGSKTVSQEQYAAKIRWHREGGAYLLITEEDIQREVENPKSVDVTLLTAVDDF